MVNSTIGQVIDSFFHLATDMTGFRSDDSSFTDLSVYSEILKSRSAIVKEIDSRGFEIDIDLVQNLHCIELIEIDREECPTRPASGCVWLKSVKPIPDTIKILSVTNSIGTLKFIHERWDRLSVEKRLPSGQAQPLYTFKNVGGERYLYIYNNETIKNIQISAVFENPIDPVEFCSGKRHCNPYELSIHTPQDMVDNILQRIYAKIIGQRQNTRPDVVNNDSPVN
jgi:hypothetical protein